MKINILNEILLVIYFQDLINLILSKYSKVIFQVEMVYFWGGGFLPQLFENETFSDTTLLRKKGLILRPLSN
ncbi:hypothetical protein C0J52_03726 [Blattella germanica]|nr:hypothetical protein C0J52_03726 [Blattella germanica]